MKINKKNPLIFIIPAVVLIAIIAICAVVLGNKKEDKETARSDAEKSEVAVIKEPETARAEIVEEEGIKEDDDEIVIYERPTGDQTMTAIRLPSGMPYVNWAITIAKDDRFGYSQNRRNGDPDFDRTSFVWYAISQEGFEAGKYPFGGLVQAKDAIMSAGFTLLEVTSADMVQPGDILLNDRHIEIYIGNGQSVGARRGEAFRDDNGNIAYRMQDCIVGDQDGEEIAVGPYLYAWWTAPENGTHYVLRPPADYSVDGSKDWSVAVDKYSEGDQVNPTMSLDDVPFRMFENDDDMVKEVDGVTIDLLEEAIESGKLVLPENAWFLGFDFVTGNITYTSGGETFTLEWKEHYHNVH